MEETALLSHISDALEARDKDVLYFHCFDLCQDGMTAQLSSRALLRHLKSKGGRLGDFQIELYRKVRHRHGLLWKATRVTPNKFIANTVSMNTKAIPNL